MRLSALVLAAGLAVPGVALAYAEVEKAIESVATMTALDVSASVPVGIGDTPAIGCTPITSAVQFCGSALGWTSTSPASPEINAAYRIDARHYAQYLIEELGSDDGLTARDMQQLVLDNIALVSGTPPELISVGPASLGLLTGDTVVYKAKIQGMDVVFANSVFLQPKRVMQIMTFAVGAEYTAQQADYQAALLSNTKLAK
jgi:hypothetical protein